MSDIAELLGSHIQTLFLTVVRLFCFFWCIPGMGDFVVPRRIRLVVALAVSFPVAQVLQAEASVSLSTILGEAMVGFFLGTLVRIFFDSFVFLGALLGHQTNFGNAVRSDLGRQTRDLFSVFFNLFFVAIFFTTDLYLLLLQGICATYKTIPVGLTLRDAGFLESGLLSLESGLTSAFSLVVPFWVMGILYYMILGFLNRVIPMLPVFFVGQPLMIVCVFLMLTVCLSRFASGFFKVWIDFVYKIFVI